MGPIFNASALIIIILLTAVLLFRYGRKPVRPFYAVMGSVFYFIVCGFLLLTFFHTPAYSGSYTPLWELERLNKGYSIPIHQVIITLICMSSVLIFIESVRLKVIVFLLSIVIIFLLGKHFFIITNGSKEYTSSPNRINIVSRGRIYHTKTYIGYVKSLLYSMLPDISISLSKGWINEIGIQQRLSEEYVYDFTSQINLYEIGLEQYDVKTEWYTPITGIYRIQPVPVGFWYPGGRIKDNISRLELRRR